MTAKSFCVTRNLNVKYLNPTYSKCSYTFKTTIIRKGQTTVWIKVDIYDEKNSLCAYADADFAIINEADAKKKNIANYDISVLTSKV